jgi:hypothetical protein
MKQLGIFIVLSVGVIFTGVSISLFGWVPFLVGVAAFVMWKIAGQLSGKQPR